MKNKYYIPKIEEFCVGFEYEIFDTIKWNSESLKIEDLMKGSIELGSYLESALSCDFIRVKYLDKSDIENLGFIFDKKNKCYVSKKTILGVGCGDDIKINIYYDNDDNSTIVLFKENRGFETTMFEGFIKNKFELNDLLKNKLRI